MEGSSQSTTVSIGHVRIWRDVQLMESVKPGWEADHQECTATDMQDEEQVLYNCPWMGDWYTPKKWINAE
jgi:hypothetical protein